MSTWPLSWAYTPTTFWEEWHIFLNISNHPMSWTLRNKSHVFQPITNHFLAPQNNYGIWFTTKAPMDRPFLHSISTSWWLWDNCWGGQFVHALHLIKKNTIASYTTTTIVGYIIYQLTVQNTLCRGEVWQMWKHPPCYGIQKTQRKQHKSVYQENHQSGALHWVI